jgi:glycosyltransferase involved in cell wall biosynthesis
MRIGVNTLPLHPGAIGGMENYVYHLLSHLTLLYPADTYYLFVTEYNHQVFDFQRHNVVRVWLNEINPSRFEKGLARLAKALERPSPPAAQWARMWLARLALQSCIREFQLDLWFCPLIALDPPRVEVPSVISVPDIQYEFHAEFFSPEVLRWSRKRYPRSCRGATKVLTLSEYSKKTIVAKYRLPKDKVRAVPLAIGEEFGRPWDAEALEGVRRKYRLPVEYAFYPGNTWRHKNHTTLLYALSAYQKKYGRRLPCVFTGAAKEGHAQVLQVVAELNLTDDILFLGYIPKEDMPLLYRGAALLVFPSLFEGFGLPLLEAMASACPILCANTTSIPEVVGDAALMIDPHNPEAMAEGMHRILTDDQLRDRLVASGKERVKRFSWQQTAAETAKVFQEAYLQGRKWQGST